MRAREAILEELKHRWMDGRRAGMVVPHDLSRFYHPQTNYFCGAGTMRCSICKTGVLEYSRSAYNGHFMANCSGVDCVCWRE